MGCGLGGCYSCVVLDARAGQRAALRAVLHRGPGVRRRAASSGRRWRTDMDLSVSIGSLTLPNPLIAASGCFGYGVEYADVVDLSTLGGVAVKGLFLGRARRPPAAAHRRNAVRDAERDRPAGHRRPPLHRASSCPSCAIAAPSSSSTSAARRSTNTSRWRAILSDAEGVAALELNISCPNIKEGGITFGCSLPGTHAVVSAVRKVTTLPVIPKLTPNVTDVASFARAAEEAGADAISLVNTFLAMAIDVETRRPKLTNIVGGLSGPAIRPIAVRMVYECRQAVKIPIIGMGGIATADDVLEFMIAGANAVQVGTANFVDPFIWTKLLDGMRDYMTRHKLVAARGHRRHASTRRKKEQGVDQLLVALDVETGAEALALADALRGVAGGFKIGSRLFTAEGPSIVRSAGRARRPRVPRSQVPRHSQHRRDARSRGDVARRVDGERARVRRSCDDAGGARRGARDRRRAKGRTPPLVIAVTVLTSMNDATLRRPACTRRAGSGAAAGRAGAGAGLDGVVASPQETALIRQRCGPDFAIVTPGIRGGSAATWRRRTIRSGR